MLICCMFLKMHTIIIKFDGINSKILIEPVIIRFGALTQKETKCLSFTYCINVLHALEKIQHANYRYRFQFFDFSSYLSIFLRSRDKIK